MTALSALVAVSRYARAPVYNGDGKLAQPAENRLRIGIDLKPLDRSEFGWAEFYRVHVGARAGPTWRELHLFHVFNIDKLDAHLPHAKLRFLDRNQSLSPLGVRHKRCREASSRQPPFTRGIVDTETNHPSRMTAQPNVRNQEPLSSGGMSEKLAGADVPPEASASLAVTTEKSRGRALLDARRPASCRIDS